MTDSPLPGEFGVLYERNFAAVYTFLKNLKVQDPEDICQDVFEIALKKFDHFDPSRSRNAERAWLCTIAWNLVRNEWRGKQRERSGMAMVAYLPSLSHGEYASMPSEQQALAQSLLDGFLDELDEKTRLEFILSKVGGMSSREIARECKDNHNAVQSRLREANRVFTKRFQQDSRRVRLIAEARAQVPAQAQAKVRSALMLSPAWLARENGAIGASGGTSWLSGSIGKMAAAFLTATAITSAVIVAGPKRAESSPEVPRAAEPRSAETPTRPPLPAMEPIDVPPTPPPILPAPSITSITSAPAAKQSPTKEPSPTAKEHLLNARALLEQGRPDEALDILRKNPPPSSANLGFQWRATEVFALCKAGREREAKGRIRVWNAEHPGDFSPAQVADPCSP